MGKEEGGERGTDGQMFHLYGLLPLETVIARRDDRCWMIDEHASQFQVHGDDIAMRVQRLPSQGMRAVEIRVDGGKQIRGLVAETRDEDFHVRDARDLPLKRAEGLDAARGSQGWMHEVITVTEEGVVQKA